MFYNFCTKRNQGLSGMGRVSRGCLRAIVKCLRATRRLSAALLLVTAFAPVNANAAPASETLILYGGFGHMANSAQPEFARILTEPSARADRALIERVTTAAIAAERFGLSDYGVIGSNERLREVLNERAGEKLKRVGLKDIVAYFSKAYVLVLSGTLEHHVGVFSENRQAKKRDEHFIVGISAMLVELNGDLGESRVVLSSTVTDEATLCDFGKCDLPGFIPAAERRGYFAKAYARAAGMAVKRLAEKSRNTDGSKIEDFVDRAMVTGVYVDQPEARHLFGVKDPAARPSSCRVSSQCADGKRCNPLMAFIANTATAALSRDGYMVLPPLRWAQWGNMASERTAVSMALSRGLSAVEGTLKINVSEKSADIKVTAVLNGFGHEDVPFEGTDKAVHRYHSASMLLCLYETDTLETSRITRVRDALRYTNEAKAPVHEIVIVGDPPAKPEVSRAFNLISIRNSFGGM